MKNHLSVHNRQEREKYHTFWIMPLPILLNMILKGYEPKNLSTRNIFFIGPDKRIIIMCE